MHASDLAVLQLNAVSIFFVLASIASSRLFVMQRELAIGPHTPATAFLGIQNRVPATRHEFFVLAPCQNKVAGYPSAAPPDGSRGKASRPAYYTCCWLAVPRFDICRTGFCTQLY